MYNFNQENIKKNTVKKTIKTIRTIIKNRIKTTQIKIYLFISHKMVTFLIITQCHQLVVILALMTIVMMMMIMMMLLLKIIDNVKAVYTGRNERHTTTLLTYIHTYI